MEKANRIATTQSAAPKRTTIQTLPDGPQRRGRINKRRVVQIRRELDYLRIARAGREQHSADLFGTRREVFETPYRFIQNRCAQTAIKYHIVNIAPRPNIRPARGRWRASRRAANRRA